LDFTSIRPACFGLDRSVEAVIARGYPPRSTDYAMHRGTGFENHRVFRAHAKKARQVNNTGRADNPSNTVAGKTEVQSDGRIRRWAWVAEEGMFLRVILLEDCETVHNAFFDRSFKESRQ